MVRRWVALIGASWIVAQAQVPSNTVAQEAAGGTVPHLVRPGESIYRIAHEQFEDPRRWPEVARLNRLTRPSQLQPGQRLLLPISLLKGQLANATVAYVRGGVQADGRPLRIGDRITEAALIDVGPNGFLSLALGDGSLVQLQAGSLARLVRLRDLPRAARHTVIQLDGGRVELTVSPQAPGSRFDIKTPLATAGVRGTRFGVGVPVDRPLTATDVSEGRVALFGEHQASVPGPELVAGQGAVARSGVPAQVRSLLPAPGWDMPELRIEALPAALPARSVAGAAGVRVEIAEDNAFTRVVDVVQGPTPAVGAGLPDGLYEARARAYDDDGLMGDSSTVRLRIKTLPIAPLVRSPSPQAVLPPAPVDLRCTEVPGATGYRFQVATDAAFLSLLTEKDVTTAQCAFRLDAPPTGVLFWRVATVAPEPDGRLDRGPFGDASTVEIRPLPVPPSDDDLAVKGDEVHWTSVAGYRYRVQVASDASFAEVLSDVEVDAPPARLPLPTGCRPIALRLQAIDDAGRRSAFTGTRLIGGAARVCSGEDTPVTGSDGLPIQLSP